MKNVLISGGSIAGPALARSLRRRGFHPTVVERAPAPRRGGQAVDIRGAALDAADRLGILAEARALATRMRGMSVLDGDGNEVMSTTEETYSGGRLDGDDIEIMRDDLTRLLVDGTRDGVEYVFDDSITAVEQDGRGARVTFERAEPRTFDLVVGADGLHSNVRRLVFGEESRFIHHLGTYLAFFRADNFLDLDNWQMWLRDGDRGYGIYPARENAEIVISFGFGSPPLDYDHRDVEQQKRIVAEQFTGLRWEAPRLLEAMWKAPDFYFDSMAQIRMDHWSAGRVVLLGDAGYCPSPLSGQGTSLALVGACVLADELGVAGDDHRAAFARYEERMHPFVELNQALATENPGGPASEESVERAKNAISLGDRTTAG
ncbi:FAD-dependent monooxygenase [Streptosporangium roseum]|uniref:Oxidoreductase n=1 Tax=Streptosporangium roseum (strain ATCC 12428 / DSM 43021 / JCM 3005 / KCTC 9067 / NCIMB 10171 / NRRL 2505 / NI 9100) TaxID=479432 RepID=D2B2Z2_STRRD|nr:FAD-dependent monooxygenase [Streptosporangium roseum]ACZ85472.1 putative oxidoreductase [Streptosporangium roseum DSM 43021]